MSSVNGWAAKAAYAIIEDLHLVIHHELSDEQKRVLDHDHYVVPHKHYITCDLPSQERLAAIIATHAEPLMALLRRSKRDHYNWCDASIENTRMSDDQCTCGADAWNARVDAALEGGK